MKQPEEPAPSQPSAKNRARWFVLAGIGLGAVMGAIDASIVNISLPTLQEYFATNLAVVEWIVLSYILVLTALILGAARLGDMLNKKKLYLLGLSVFTLGSLLCALSQSIYWLIAFRALQGFGAAFTQGLGFAIVTEVFPAQERGRAFGLLGSILSIGIASGPPLGGLIIGTLGWHWIFLINIPVGIASLLVVSRFVPDLHPSRRQQRFDLAGALVLFVALGAYALALTLGQDLGFNRPIVGLLLAAACVGLIVFFLVERRVKQPMIELSLFRNFLFDLNLAMGFLVSCVLAGLFILPYYLQLVKGYPTALVGLLMMVDPLGMAVVGPVAGALSDRFGPRAISIAGLAVVAAGCLTLGALRLGTTQAGFILSMIPIGLGMGLFVSPNNSAIMGAVSRERLGIASGLVALARMLGQTTGLPLMGVLFSGYTFAAANLPAGSDFSQAAPAALLAGTQGAFNAAAFAVMAAVAIAILAFLIDRRQRKTALQRKLD